MSAVRLRTRYLAVGGAVLCLAALTASAGVASSQRGVPAQEVRMYSTSGTTQLRTAVVDPFFFGGPQRDAAFAMSRSAGATYVKLGVSWRAIAPQTPPTGFDPEDPTSPGYSWTGLDAIVESAASAGLTPILSVSDNPPWAYAKRPSGVNAGTPKASAIGSFAKALATHYAGTGDLPAVHAFEVWNEPNLSLNLGPVVNASAYRAMVNAVAASVHAVDSKNVVLAGGLDPFGHPKSKTQKWYSVYPLKYMRSLLCLSTGPHPHATCHAKIHFDVWSHHPYTFGGPFGKAKVPGNVMLGNLPQMRSLLRAGVRLHHVVSSHPVQFWITEFGWDTNPPRPHAASLGLASRWTAESLYQAWRSGVSLLTWFILADRRGPSPYQSGLYFHASSLSRARPKPVLTAFRFPFVAYLHRSSVSVWGRDATSDRERVAIQLRHAKSGSWRTVGYVVANPNGIFRATMKLKAKKQDWLRAVASGSGKSLAFSLRVPHASPKIGPWGST